MNQYLYKRNIESYFGVILNRFLNNFNYYLLRILQRIYRSSNWRNIEKKNAIFVFYLKSDYYAGSLLDILYLIVIACLVIYDKTIILWTKILRKCLFGGKLLFSEHDWSLKKLKLKNMVRFGGLQERNVRIKKLARFEESCSVYKGKQNF